MCTVTYLPINNNSFILTSSRDVPFSREKALYPKKYIEDGVELTYPKDGKAGGTWIGTSSKNRLLCLLNGGFENHESKEFYKSSRGEIVKNLLKTETIDQAIAEINLMDIEPFTLVIVDWNTKLQLIEFVWDGKKKHIEYLPQETRIWSSSTLYTQEMKTMRKNWFKDWLSQFKIKNLPFKTVKDEILNFHHTAGVGNPKVDVLMERSNVGTVSITSVKKEENDIAMSYKDILDK